MHDDLPPVSPSSEDDPLLRAACARIRATADPEVGAIALLDTVQRELGVAGGLVVLRDVLGARVLASVGLPSEWTASWSDARGPSLEEALRAGVVRESLADPNPTIDLHLKRLGVRGVLTLPLSEGGRTFGALVLVSTGREAFPDGDCARLEGIAAVFAEWVAPWVPRERDVHELLEPEIVEALAPPVAAPPDALASSIGAISVATLDADGCFREAGRSFEELVGAPPGSLVGESLAAALAPQDEPRARSAIATARAETVAVLPSATPRVPAETTGRPMALDLILSRRDESSIVVFGLPVVDVLAAAGGDEAPPTGEGGGLRRPSSGVMILDRRKIETSEQWRRWSGELLAVLGGSTVVLDPGGRIVELGSDWLPDGEGSSVGRLGRPFGDLFDSERAEVLEVLRAVAREGTWSGRLSSRGIPVPVHLRAVLDDRGELEAIVGARLPERSPDVRDLFEKVPVGLILVDRGLQVLDTNAELPTVLRGCGLPEDLRGVDLRGLAPFRTREAQEALESLPRLGSLDLPDVRLERADLADPLVVQLHGQELRDADGQPVGFLLTLLGRVGKTELENRLIEAQKMDSIGNFAAGLAHDFGNLAAVILGKARAVRERMESNPTTVRQVVDIEVAAKRAQHLAEELIRFARGGRSRDNTLELNRLITEVVALIEASVGGNIDVKFELAEGLPSIEGDEVELQQMVLNLCLNARDAMEGGGTLTIETRALARRELDLLGTGNPVKSGVSLRIRDTGTGIPEEVRKHIFEPFFSTKDEQSNGLGLAMVYAIVRRHGGTIDVKSEPGRGTAFEILLPGAGSVTDERAARKRVLVADDEPAFREMIRLILEDEGHDVELVRDGVEALAAIRRGHRDLGLVILDLMMPGVGGLGVLEELRSLAPELPVLITSGWAEPEDLEIALRRGARRVLRKPYRAAELRQAVGALVGERPVAEAGAWGTVPTADTAPGRNPAEIDSDPSVG